MELLKVLFCRPSRTIPGNRFFLVVTRTAHIAAMGVLLGGVAFHVPEHDLWTAFLWTTGTGAALLALHLYKSCIFLYQGSGVAMALKLVLLVLSKACPDFRVELYLLATAVASVGSHMPGAWRHFSFLDWEVVTDPKPRPPHPP